MTDTSLFGKVKALAFDLDGTLLRPDKTLSERTLRAVRNCADRGMNIIIATGRSLRSGEIYREQLGVSGPQVYYNGAEVVDMPGGTMIHAGFLDPEPVLFCAGLAKKLGLYFQVYFPRGFAGPEETLMAERLTEEAALYAKSTGIRAIEGDLEEYLSRAAMPGVIKAMFISDEGRHKKLQKTLREKYGDSLYVVRSTPRFLEVLAPGVSKGAGLVHALNHLGLGPEEALAFGDEENDIPMLRAAGFSAAPANAPRSVRKLSRFHIPSNADDGVAVFLEEQLAACGPGCSARP
ncbi:MAG: Cof-type HAD-IIB family hydrolase [Spirochaetaceae bacterium]|jgi:Cof subfamily protein (haloacid dehalogenase superfamily)|nr:Cof-type HAD-IIB family hydrolase [Spirochaetaceae bacterium]